MHGASIGESKLLLGLADLLTMHDQNLHILLTSQTASSAGVIGANLPKNAIHQMAPVDTPATAARFISHWRPDLCIFAEGEIWPNLLLASKRSGSRIALINARMTETSLRGWHRFPKTARKLFSIFDLILAADQQTATGLSGFTKSPVRAIGNLKAALAARQRHQAPPPTNETLRAFAQSGLTILGASTHASEEALLLNALEYLDHTARLILAPRHIKRAVEIEALVRATGKPYTLRSSGKDVSPDTEIIIADTFGEMDLWYGLADHVYLGGSAKPGIGGHSPLEPLSFGHNVITGPYTDNFSETYKDLIANKWAHIVQTPEALAACLTATLAPEEGALDAYFEKQKQPATQTLTDLQTLLLKRATS
jgi:3-deoxy-D-manno-octulosonic-acid transferase